MKNRMKNGFKPIVIFIPTKKKRKRPHKFYGYGEEEDILDQRSNILGGSIMKVLLYKDPIPYGNLLSRN